MTDEAPPTHLTISVPMRDDGQISKTQFRKALGTLTYYLDGQVSAQELYVLMRSSVNIREIRGYGDEGEVGYD